MRAVTVLLTVGAAAFAQAPPQLPFIARNKCPFEACIYREWTALQDVPLYDSADSSRQTGLLGKGEKITALGGLVITHRPGVIHMDRDLPGLKLKRGDTILTYTYAGEGFSQAWVNGTFHEEFDISFTKWPDGSGCGGAHCAATYVDLGKKVWWAEVRLTSGEVKWLEPNDAIFKGLNALDPR